MASLSKEQVAQHNSRQSCWIVLHGKVWDVTDFITEHPGGPGLILKFAGKDATESYNEIHLPHLVEETLPPKSHLGTLNDTSSSRSHGQAAESKGECPDEQKTSSCVPLNAIISVSDFEKIARTYLSNVGWSYYSSGADDELCLEASRRLFREMSLRPRILRNVESVCTNTTIMGIPCSLPIYFSPTGQGKYAHRDAECLIAQVSGKEGVPYCMPTTSPYEAIFNKQAVLNQQLFFQLYTGKDKGRTIALMQRIEELGAAAIFLTVDSPITGKREADDRIRASEGDDTISSTAGGVAKTLSSGLLNAALSWVDLAWIQTSTKLPVVLKGIQTVEDAVLAHRHGVAGIVLSNHGGRSLDTAQAPMQTLLEIRRHAPHILTKPTCGRFQVFVDGEFRRGTDIVKAIALGATAVGVGRPVLYSMCAGYGESGLHRLVQILRMEIYTAMAFMGAKNITELVPEMVNSETAEQSLSRRIKL